MWVIYDSELGEYAVDEGGLMATRSRTQAEAWCDMVSDFWEVEWMEPGDVARRNRILAAEEQERSLS